MSGGSNHNRVRNKLVSFRLTPEEYRCMESRIKVTGLPKNEFIIRSVLEQHIGIRVGKFESDRLSLEIRRLRRELANIQTPEEMDELLKQCKSLLNQVVQITNAEKEEVYNG